MGWWYNYTALDAATPRIKEMYADGLSLSKIAEETGFSRSTIRERLVKEQVPIRYASDRTKAELAVPKVLSDDEVERLRRLVGFVPENEPRRRRNQKSGG